MKSKLKSKKSKTISTSIRTEERKQSRPPAGASIIEKTVSTRTEEIENGWLVTKNTSGRYRTKEDKEDDYGHYFDFDEKYFSEEDPLDISINDKSLADAFDEEE